jgi:hypothetical protein
MRVLLFIWWMQFMLDARSDGALGKRDIALSDKSHARAQLGHCIAAR